MYSVNLFLGLFPEEIKPENRGENIISLGVFTYKLLWRKWSWAPHCPSQIWTCRIGWRKEPIPSISYSALSPGIPIQCFCVWFLLLYNTVAISRVRYYIRILCTLQHAHHQKFRFHLSPRCWPPLPIYASLHSPSLLVTTTVLCIYVFVFIWFGLLIYYVSFFLYSTYEWNHIVFVSFHLTYFT